MKFSQKMILIFSLMLIITGVLLATYSTRISLASSDRYTASRFRNMSATIAKSIEQQISMMDLAVDELTDNTSFMAALNQFIRDDSDDRKMANAARNAVLQQLYRSPLVDYFYRVTFYTREGQYVTSRVEKDDYLESGTNQAREVLSSLPWLDQLDAETSRRLILSSHNDFLSVRRDIRVYGIVRAVMFHGKLIGYVEISDLYDQLEAMMKMVDRDDIETQAVFDDGTLLYTSMGAAAAYPTDLAESTMIDWVDPASGIQQQVMRTRIDSLELNLYIAQSREVAESLQNEIRRSHIRTTVLIMIPTLLLIGFVSIHLTRSINHLTRKVRQLPVSAVLEHDEATLHTLLETVTSSSDREIHELEQVFNTMMLHLRESTMNEMAMREGTLQAQLNALQTQINPHFIYNTLNIISAKSMESGNLDVIEICDQFAQMLRYSTDTRSNTATMAEEIENVRNYLLLAKARYEDDLDFVIDIPADLEALRVPKLTLQPIVENALTHGYDGRNTKRYLSITGRIEHEQLILEMHDNGTGFSSEVLETLQRQIAEIQKGNATIQETGGHIGLLNTCLRLHYYSRGEMYISIGNDQGAVVRLTMPYRLA